MAYKLVDDVINHDVGDAIAKLVLIALARFANQNNQCFPSLAKSVKSRTFLTPQCVGS